MISKISWFQSLLSNGSACAAYFEGNPEKELMDVFMVFDKDGSGTISPEARGGGAAAKFRV
jgi:Ca2+-binding EF-hand superfamily protein